MHRQAAIFERAGHLIARSAFAHGVGEYGVQLPPLVLHADKTPMAVLKLPHEHTPGTPVEPLHDRTQPHQGHCVRLHPQRRQTDGQAGAEVPPRTV